MRIIELTCPVEFIIRFVGQGKEIPIGSQWNKFRSTKGDAAVASRADTSRFARAWQPQPEAAGFVRDVLAVFCEGCPAVSKFADLLHQQTGTRLIDWIDHVALPAGGILESELERTGFVPHDQLQYVVWEHQAGLFPQVITHPSASWRLALRVESVADFLAARGFDQGTPIEGEPLAPLRKACVGGDSHFQFWVVERHGYRGWETLELTSAQVEAVLDYDEAFWRRQRQFEDPEQGFAETRELIRAAVIDLGAAQASDLFFAAERRYWTHRNHAARFQKARQDALGLGWANHDHHTYRSSRKHFLELIALLEDMGLVCRERFYAGQEAGWGAQVLEQEESQVVVFADVDLSAAEVSDDFAHEPLPQQGHFGTVGLWCLLHGEAFLEAGLHHLECRFDFDAARLQFQQAGIRVMKPFTDLPYLKQTFTEGELWPVHAQRRDAALASGAITDRQAEQFCQSGALGSHLEMLQRDDGYKGFNPSGINAIIRATDPRRLVDGEVAAEKENGFQVGHGAA